MFHSIYNLYCIYSQKCPGNSWMFTFVSRFNFDKKNGFSCHESDSVRLMNEKCRQMTRNRRFQAYFTLTVIFWTQSEKKKQRWRVKRQEARNRLFWGSFVRSQSGYKAWSFVVYPTELHMCVLCRFSWGGSSPARGGAAAV